MKEILNSRWNYKLFEANGKLILSVLCGTVGVFETNIVLNADEEEQFKHRGEIFIKDLSAQIRNAPNSYTDRHIQISD